MSYEDFADQVRRYERYLEGLRSAKASIDRAIRLVNGEERWMFFEAWPKDPPADPWQLDE